MAMTPDELCERLQAICPRPIRIQIHENRSTYAAARREKDGTIRLMIHRLFLYSSTPVLQALIRFALSRDNQAKATIRQMALLYFTKIEPPAPDLGLSDAQGRVIDLQVIYDQANRNFFEGKIGVPIAWFNPPPYRRYRHITYGSYDRTRPLIRINRLLDSSEIPLPFVEFIVYHEMLHVVCASKIDGRGRISVHTAEFRQREAKHPHYALAKDWGKKGLKFFKDTHGRA
ncbi:MAG: hypothetical protein HW387_1125 [Parachlamydiales bacterium]|nr:hypothetical protein [Parachlamydiales bacterium]